MSCLAADDGPSERRPPLILARKSQPASNGLHLEGSEVTTEPLWTAKTEKSSSSIFFSTTLFERCASGGVAGLGGLIKGSGSWHSLFTSNSDLGQMSTEMERVRAHRYVCVISQVFGECSALIGTGRHFVGLYCRMPLPILLLIRVRPTHFGTRSKPGPLEVISILLRRLVQPSSGAQSCALVEADWRK